MGAQRVLVSLDAQITMMLLCLHACSAQSMWKAAFSPSFDLQPEPVQAESKFLVLNSSQISWFSAETSPVAM